MRDTNRDKLGKGIAKVNSRDKVMTTRDTITGKRKVRVNHNTWVYTSCATDEEAIEKFNRLHGI